MPPPRALSADEPSPASSPQSPSEMAQILRNFLEHASSGAVLEDGKVVFELEKAQVRVSDEHGRCTLQIWSGERNLVRTVVGVRPREGMLRLSTQRFGQAQPKALILTHETQRRDPARREPARQAYLRLLQRVLAREFPEWQVEGFRAAMDLERSFGPAYIRGTLVRGKEAWAVIGVSATESQAIIDGILTLGVLWLHLCRERSEGRLLYKGLRVVVPRGAGSLTLARMAWMNPASAAWEMFELEECNEELEPRDSADQGNLRTRLVHHPDERTAQERFAPAIADVLSLVPQGEQGRVEQRLRSSTELAFLLHGLEFAKAKVSLVPGSFVHRLEITVGVGPAETVLTAATHSDLAERVAELFARRDARVAHRSRTWHLQPPGRAIGAFTGRPAHGKALGSSAAEKPGGLQRLELWERALAAQQDPLFRAVPERWLGSVLRENLAPLTRSLAPPPSARIGVAEAFANEADPDSRGNRLGVDEKPTGWAWQRSPTPKAAERLIPRFDPRFVYTQVPAIAGAGDRGMLDLLGVTEDGRLAVIELKASDDLQLPMQGLDYWIRVRHHHVSALDPSTGGSSGPSELQRHGYFREVELSPLPPRLYLVAPALHVHPATETVLRYLSPQVEWTLLALDERWRQEIRVVWRKSGGRPRE